MIGTKTWKKSAVALHNALLYNRIIALPVRLFVGMKNTFFFIMNPNIHYSYGTAPAKETCVGIGKRVHYVGTDLV